MNFADFQPKMKELSNRPENLFELKATNSDWRVTKKGWPDFFCLKPDGTPACVEVNPRTKSGRTKKLKPEQVMVMKVLTAAGIECYVSDGVSLWRFDPTKH